MVWPLELVKLMVLPVIVWPLPEPGVKVPATPMVPLEGSTLLKLLSVRLP